MRSIAASPVLAVALAALIMPASVLGQETSANATEQAVTTVCLQVTGAEVTGQTDAMTLAQSLLDGEAQGEVVDGAACEPGVAADQTPDELTEAPMDGTAYVDFVAHGAGAAVQLAALAKQSENASGIDGLDRAARRLARWAGMQRRWLDRHPPQACYRDVHTQWRRGVVRVRDGAKGVRKALRTLRPQPMRRAVRDISAGTQALVGADLDSVARACASANDA